MYKIFFIALLVISLPAYPGRFQERGFKNACDKLHPEVSIVYKQHPDGKLIYGSMCNSYRQGSSEKRCCKFRAASEFRENCFDYKQKIKLLAGQARQRMQRKVNLYCSKF